MAERYIGLMSGTSLDGVDGVLLDFSGAAPLVTHHASRPFDATLRAELLALNSAGQDELHRAALAANALVRVYAQVVADLLVASALKPSQVAAIGAHGQTVRHRPGEFDVDPASGRAAVGYTLQLNNPSLLAELTGIAVAADFRSRDVAAGGQGAPLAPFFHAAVFARSDATVAVLNVGGISNLTVLPATAATAATATNAGAQMGFDCGPGNALMDHWVHQHSGAAYDDGGQWAATGQVDAALLASFLADPYFSLAPPKSTGRDRFHPAWLDQHLLRHPGLRAQDVQASLCELTARSCADAVRAFGAQASELLVCGGGVYNQALLRRLQALLPNLAVRSSAARGVPPMQVEAAAFAWLARKTVRGEALDLQSTTGARGSRVLGCVYPA